MGKTGVNVQWHKPKIGEIWEWTWSSSSHTTVVMVTGPSREDYCNGADSFDECFPCLYISDGADARQAMNTLEPKTGEIWQWSCGDNVTSVLILDSTRTDDVFHDVLCRTCATTSQQTWPVGEQIPWAFSDEYAYGWQRIA